MKQKYLHPEILIGILDLEIISSSPTLAVTAAGDDNAGYDVSWYG